jgi:hypothetical protein
MACIYQSTLLYHLHDFAVMQIHCFGFTLSPGHYRRPISRRVSCYALFKWWLLLSQHPRCLRNRTSLSTEHKLGTLAGGLGCFPFEHGGYPPYSHSRDSRCGIRSLIEGGRLVAPAFHSVALPPQRSDPRLSQKTFRGEPDISAFD